MFFVSRWGRANFRIKQPTHSKIYEHSFVMNKLPTLAIIGPGKVGTSIGMLAARAGYSVAAVGGRHKESTITAARQIDKNVRACDIAGAIFFVAGRLKKAAVSTPFVGGEEFEPQMQVSAEGFYHTIKNMQIFKAIYHQAEKKRFDIYDIGKNIGVNISNALSSIHTRALPRYLVWVLVGLIILLLLINYIITF